MYTRIPIYFDSDSRDDYESREAVEDEAFAARDAKLCEDEKPLDADNIAGRSCDGAEEWRQRCMRMKADFENYKRNAEAERDRLAEIGKECVLADMFCIAEHLERAVSSIKDKKANSGVVEGLELVRKDIEKVFEKYGIERIPALGEIFDPEVHEAVAVVEAEGVSEGTIVEELHPGYRRSGSLLCPAKVVVAK